MNYLSTYLAFLSLLVQRSPEMCLFHISKIILGTDTFELWTRIQIGPSPDHKDGENGFRLQSTLPIKKSNLLGLKK